MRLRWRTPVSWKKAQKFEGDGVQSNGLGIIQGNFYFAPRPLAALASPEPRVPHEPPRAAPPLPAGAPPRAGPPATRDGAGVENFGVGFEDVGGFSTKDVSVVLYLLADDIL